MSSITEKLTEFRAQRNALEAQIREVAKQVFTEESAGLFEKFPALQSFRWTQYTPYFNDGDSCEFSAHTDYINMRYTSPDGSEESANEDDEDEDYDDNETTDVDIDEHGFIKRYQSIAGKYELVSTEVKATDRDYCANAVIGFLKNFDEDVLLSMFGDHVQITVSRDGVSVDEYSHE